MKNLKFKIKNLKLLTKSESGQIFVFTLALIFFIALLVCLFLNSAVISLYKMKLQTTADACALTGAAYQAKMLDIIGDINDIISKLYVAAQVVMAMPCLWNWDFTGYEPYNEVYKPFIKEIVLDFLEPLQDKIAAYAGIGTPLVMQYVANKNMEKSIAIPIHNFDLNYKLGWEDTDNMDKYRIENGMYFFYTCTIYVWGIPIPITPLPLWPLLWEETGEGEQAEQIKDAQDKCRNKYWHLDPDDHSCGSPTGCYRYYADHEKYLEDTDGDGTYSNQEKSEAVKNCINDKTGLGTEEGMGIQGPSLYRKLFLMKDREFITYSAVAVIGPSIGYEKFFLGKLFNFKKFEHIDFGNLSLSSLSDIQNILEGVASGGWFAVAAAKPYEGEVWDGTNSFWALLGGTLSDILEGAFSADLNQMFAESNFSKPYKVWLVRIKDERLKPEIWLPNKDKYLH